MRSALPSHEPGLPEVRGNLSSGARSLAFRILNPNVAALSLAAACILTVPGCKDSGGNSPVPIDSQGGTGDGSTETQGMSGTLDSTAGTGGGSGSATLSGTMGVDGTVSDSADSASETTAGEECHRVSWRGIALPIYNSLFGDTTSIPGGPGQLPLLCVGEEDFSTHGVQGSVELCAPQDLGVDFADEDDPTVIAMIQQAREACEANFDHSSFGLEPTYDNGTNTYNFSRVECVAVGESHPFLGNADGFCNFPGPPVLHFSSLGEPCDEGQQCLDLQEAQVDCEGYSEEVADSVEYNPAKQLVYISRSFAGDLDRILGCEYSPFAADGALDPTSWSVLAGMGFKQGDRLASVTIHGAPGQPLQSIDLTQGDSLMGLIPESGSLPNELTIDFLRKGSPHKLEVRLAD